MAPWSVERAIETHRRHQVQIKLAPAAESGYTLTAIRVTAPSSLRQGASGAAAADLEPRRGGGASGALVLEVPQVLLRSLDDLVWRKGRR